MRSLALLSLLLSACASLRPSVEERPSPAVLQAEILFAQAEDEGRWSEDETRELGYLVGLMSVEERRDILLEWERQVALGSWRVLAMCPPLQLVSAPQR